MDMGIQIHISEIPSEVCEVMLEIRREEGHKAARDAKIQRMKR